MAATTSKARAAAPPNLISKPIEVEPPRAKARPLQKQTTFDLATWLFVLFVGIFFVQKYTHDKLL